MQPQETKSLGNWVAFLSQAEIPVLKQTDRDLTSLYEDTEKISARGVAKIIARDPMMTVKLLREILDAAGKRIGLGDFRPSCKGPFGKFVITNWKEQRQKLAA